MIGSYDIFRGGEKIGKAHISREGLYYRFRCCCTLSGKVIYRLIVTCGEQTENLGILVPDGQVFRLERLLPISRFGEGAVVIRAVPGRTKSQGIFAPVYPDEPFSYIAKLQHGRMIRQEGQIGILIEEDQPAPLSSSSK